jgi:hypothetical protein
MGRPAQVRNSLRKLQRIQEADWVSLILRTKPSRRVGRKARDKLIQKILDISLETAERLPQTKRSFRGALRETYPVELKGRYRDRRASFKEKLGGFEGKYLIYAFHRGAKCVYVGRSKQGLVRVLNQDEHFWRTASRVEVHVPRNGRDLAKLECLAYHLMHPNRADIKPASIRRHPHCPICSSQTQLKRELQDAFKLREWKTRRKHPNAETLDQSRHLPQIVTELQADRAPVNAVPRRSEGPESDPVPPSSPMSGEP